MGVSKTGNLRRRWVERWSVRLRNEGKKMHCLGLPFLGSPLWFLFPLHQRAHIPRERGGAPDVLAFREGEFRMVTVTIAMRKE